MDKRKTEGTGKDSEDRKRLDRLAWITEARFGLFIHWGIYAAAAGRWKGKEVPGAGEWIMWSGKIPVAEYEHLADNFDPTRFDAEEWVRLAKAAGMRYIVITAKHCDGFAMYHSAVSRYNIVDATPFKRDPLKELEEACDRHGLRLGFYYSHDWDWHEPDALGLDNVWDFPDRAKKVQDRYIAGKSLRQVEELVGRFHPHLIWFDVPTSVTPEHSRKFVEAVRSRFPSCIINDRVGNGLGDYGTPEQYIPTLGEQKLFEVCMTMNETWGFRRDDRNWKTPTTIIRNLVDIVSKGGNYLLNVGPTAEGLIPDASVRVLQEIARWMEGNGASIHGAGASPLSTVPWGRCTSAPGKLYLHVFGWPESGGLVVPGVRAKPNALYLLADPGRSPVSWRREGDRDLVVDLRAAALPAAALWEADTVLCLEYGGGLEVDPAVFLFDRDFPSLFESSRGQTTGPGLSYRFDNEWGIHDYMTQNWKSMEDRMRWPARSPSERTFGVEVVYGAPKECVGNKFRLSIGGSEIEATVEITGGWWSYRTVRIGSVTVPRSSSLELVVRPAAFGASMMNSSLFNLKEVRLLPE